MYVHINKYIYIYICIHVRSNAFIMVQKTYTYLCNCNYTDVHFVLGGPKVLNDMQPGRLRPGHSRRWSPAGIHRHIGCFCKSGGSFKTEFWPGVI